MCGDSKRCKREGDAARKPEECSPEQIRECHGELSEHPCVGEDRQCSLKAEEK
ncbi:MAG: hypothetical protein ACP5R5_06985 [Armatimonadota bacterium]